jgi:hypothetical protein
MSSEAAPASAVERSWWIRAAAVLVAPRAVFASLRDESDDAAEARQEPIVALAGIAGVAGVLGTSVARTILNGGGSWIVVPIWAFFGGMFYAFAVYWLGGGLLYAASRRLGSLGGWRRSRHLVALASAPVALSLVTVWPVRIAVYGKQLFFTGGDDFGRGDAIFGGLVFATFAWSLYLLIVGVRTVHGWTWGRTLAAVALAVVFPALIVIATSV